MPTTTYVDTATARAQLRSSLTGAFPGVEFTVTVAHSGNTLLVIWRDGPAPTTVQPFADTFVGTHSGDEYVIRFIPDQAVTRRGYSDEFRAALVETLSPVLFGDRATLDLDPATSDYINTWTPWGYFRYGSGMDLLNFCAQHLTPECVAAYATGTTALGMALDGYAAVWNAVTHARLEGADTPEEAVDMVAAAMLAVEMADADAIPDGLRREASALLGENRAYVAEVIGKAARVQFA